MNWEDNFREDNVHCKYEDEKDPYCQPAPISIGVCYHHQQKYKEGPLFEPWDKEKIFEYYKKQND